MFFVVLVLFVYEYSYEGFHFFFAFSTACVCLICCSSGVTDWTRSVFIAWFNSPISALTSATVPLDGP